MTNNEPQSSDEFPQGMTFTRKPVQDPYTVGVSCEKGTLYPETCVMIEDDGKSIQQLRAERQARDRKAWLARNKHLAPMSFKESHGRVNKEYHKNDK